MNISGFTVSAPVKFLALTLVFVLKLISPNECSNGSISLFKAMLQWLVNCNIKDGLF